MSDQGVFENVVEVAAPSGGCCGGACCRGEIVQLPRCGKCSAVTTADGVSRGEGPNFLPFPVTYRVLGDHVELVEEGARG